MPCLTHLTSARGVYWVTEHYPKCSPRCSAKLLPPVDTAVWLARDGALQAQGGAVRDDQEQAGGLEGLLELQHRIGEAEREVRGCAAEQDGRPPAIGDRDDLPGGRGHRVRCCRPARSWPRCWCRLWCADDLPPDRRDDLPLEIRSLRGGPASRRDAVPGHRERPAGPHRVRRVRPHDHVTGRGETVADAVEWGAR